MIMALSAVCEIGKTVEMEFHEPGTIHIGVRALVLRAATLEEWVQDRVEAGYDEDSARRHATLRQKQGFAFYEVSVD